MYLKAEIRYCKFASDFKKVLFSFTIEKQGTLIIDGRNNSKFTRPLVVLAKTLKMAKISKKNI